LLAGGLALTGKPLTVIFSMVERRVGEPGSSPPSTLAAELPGLRPTVMRSWQAVPMAWAEAGHGWRRAEGRGACVVSGMKPCLGSSSVSRRPSRKSRHWGSEWSELLSSSSSSLLPSCGVRSGGIRVCGMVSRSSGVVEGPRAGPRSPPPATTLLNPSAEAPS
jgi:hypothetical protein